MKRFLMIALALALVFALMACGGEGTEPESKGGEDGGAPVVENQEEGGGLSSLFGGSKTADLFKRIASNGNLYMELRQNVDMEGFQYTMDMAVAQKGDRNAVDMLMDGQKQSSFILDGDETWMINHGDKTYFKMNMDAAGENGEVMDEDIYDPEELAKLKHTEGKMDIDGKTYDYEAFVMEGAEQKYCYDGKDLKYMVTEMDGGQQIIEVLKLSDKAPDSMFDIPKDYTEVEF